MSSFAVWSAKKNYVNDLKQNIFWAYEFGEPENKRIFFLPAFYVYDVIKLLRWEEHVWYMETWNLLKLFLYTEIPAAPQCALELV